MASIATVELEVSVSDGVSVSPSYTPQPFRFPSTIQKEETVSCTGSAFTAFTVPSGAKALCIIPATTAASWTLKGVTGDTGVTIVPATGYTGCPALIPLGASPSIGVLNAGSTATAVLVWM